MLLRLALLVHAFWLSSAMLGAQEKLSDWPQFRGPGGQGISADKGLPVTWGPKENIVWKVALPGAGASTPIVVGPRIFVTCFSGYGVPGQPAAALDRLKLHVVCLDRGSGKILWIKHAAPKLPEQPTMRENHGYASSTPVADGERLYAFFGKTGVVAFDHDGKRLWQAEVGAGLNGWGSAASLMLAGDLLIVNASVESQSLVALDKKTGREAWQTKGIKESWNTPLLVTVAPGKSELVVAIMGKVLGLEPATGAQRWSCATDIGWYMVPSLVAEEGIVYAIGGRSGGGLAVRAGGTGDVTRSHRLWKIAKGSNVSSPIVHEGHLYWMHEGLGIAYCAELKTGKIVYEERVPGAGPIYASPVLADGKLYYVCRNGRTIVLIAGPKYERLAVNDLADRSPFNASPAVAGSRLYLRSDRFLYCVGLK
jgi:outer membrane protein assembly factor BamB